jgi:hypothetical protein
MQRVAHHEQGPMTPPAPRRRRTWVVPCHGCGSTDRARPLDETVTPAMRVILCASCGIELYRFPTGLGAGQ